MNNYSNPPIKRFEIVDRQTDKIVGNRKTFKSARNRVDKLDNDYGAYRYFVREV